ncbi:hypothetical protein [Streptomyces sp. NPDC001568]|uniref:hypothetical protein n=1 Tax=Streptomyces sp. NPDC001568 TaxID=3364588 RepID=UPI0036CF58DD
MVTRSTRTARTSAPDAPRPDAARTPASGAARNAAGDRDSVALGPLTGRWLLAGGDGRLTAYARTEGGLLRWTERTPGGPDWSGPDLFPVPDLTDLAVGQGPDGYAHFVGRRRSPDGGAVTVTYHHAVQYQTGRPLAPWQDLGTLYRKPEMSHRGGPPVAAVDARGAAHVFVRNAGRGIHLKCQDAKGDWGDWQDLRGSKTFEGISAGSTADGRVVLAAPGEKGISRWTRSDPGAPMDRGEDLPFLARDGSPVALETAPGRVTHFWHAADGSGVFAHREGAGAHGLGGAPASGAVAATRGLVDGHDCTVLALRTVDGRTALAAYPTEQEAAGLWWTEIGEEGLESPALAVDAHGRVVVASISVRGELLVNRQKDRSALSLGRWQRF